MKEIILIDYSELYFSGIGEQPPVRRSGKFVQIRHGTTEYLVISPKELTPYHTDILERFCSERALRGSYNGENKRFEILDPSWTIAGGGKFDRDTNQRYLRLYDASTAYGSFDAKGLAEKIRSVQGLEEYRLLIG